MVAQMSSYTATAHRRDRYWFVQCDQVPGATSTVTRLDQAVEHQREAIAFVAGVAEDTVEVTVRPDLDPELAAELTDAADLVEHARRDEEQARAKRHRVARSLADAGLTVRDVGTVMGVSYQRAHQLISQ